DQGLIELLYLGSGRNFPPGQIGILELAGTIKCSTGRTPLAYLDYGCYCGLGGQGWPRDKVDWNSPVFGYNPQVYRFIKSPLSWTCMEAQAYSLEDKCQKIMCDCDRKAAKCLAKAPYNPRYIFWPDFVCGVNQPKCKF
uniref:Phospholipase A2 n=1 Tax=Pelusios castaneus TaxID=367368 RepID=A0A8C8R5X0_9SAUR